MQRRRLFIVAICAAAVAACATPQADADRYAENKAWQRITKATDVTDVGGDRLRMRASNPFMARLDTLEKNTLARAAGEARARDADAFAIVFADYGKGGVSGLLGPDLSDSTERWIGTYEDLLAARDNAGIGGSGAFKSLETVVLLLPDGSPSGQPVFDTEDVYRALIDDRIDRENIKPREGIGLPFFEGSESDD